MKVRKAVIPAAGLGTRFLPATKAIPKEMIPVVDKPTIQFIVEEAVESGIEEIIIVTSRGKASIENHFDKNPELERVLSSREDGELLKMLDEISNLANIHYIRQKEPKGLGHAISCAQTFIGDEPFAVLLGDDIVDAKVPCTKQLLDMFEKYNSTILGCQIVDKKDVSKYGIVDGIYIEDDFYKVKNLIEKPSINEAPSDQAILGKYIITPRIFDFLAITRPGAGGEIQLTDALKTLAQEEDVYAYNFKGRRYDVGDKLGYLEATVEYALKREELRDDFRKYLSQLIESDLYKDSQ